MKRAVLISTLIIIIIVFAACNIGEKQKGSTEMTLYQKIARFSPTEISADISKLTDADKKALDKIIEAARLMDDIFFRQVWKGNPELLQELLKDTTAEGRERLHYFRINMGPWSLLDKNEPFIEAAPKEKPAGANYYPEDMTKDEFNNWLALLSEKEKEQAVGFFTTIRRSADKSLKMIPYNIEYKEWLEPAGRLLKEAAALTTNKSLKKFLTTRADAFLSNDYYASDITWMELDAPIDLTIGPYETYMDELFGYKAAFEVFVTIRDDAESQKLEKFGSYLQDIENNLPMEDKYRNPKLGAMSPIRVVDVIYAAGEGNRGVQTAAFNLPNDEKVIRDKGAKRVMLKNMQEAKFNKVLVPISSIVIDPEQRSNISFEAFFTHILAHELMHGLGPHNITVDGKPTNVRKELKELYPAIEEAKADITGLFAMQYLIDKGLLDKKLEEQMYTTYLASAFRSVRFGINEAHGKAVALIFNYLSEEAAIWADEESGTFKIDDTRIKQAVEDLTRAILTIEAEGSYSSAKEIIERYSVINPEMQNALDCLHDIPVDIEPSFPLAAKSAGSIR
ncbi:MAG: hypothetical protein JXA06_10945 [Bacteroidetes bacterium]|nr:hypothetical protein [Bacteroidota bacterium]